MGMNSVECSWLERSSGLAQGDCICAVSTVRPAGEQQFAFEALAGRITLTPPPLKWEMEITSPAAALLFVSSSIADADILTVLRVFAANGNEMVCQGTIDPYTLIAQAWLCVSHRKRDSRYHSHGEIQPLPLGNVVEFDIEIRPNLIVWLAGYRVAVSLRDKDCEYSGPSGGRLYNLKNELRGCGPFLHYYPRDRLVEVFDERTTLHAGPLRQAHRPAEGRT